MSGRVKLEDDRMCYVCGKDNPHGFRLDFEQPMPGRLRATVVFSKEHQGFRNIVHGGMVTMVLDEMVVNLAWKEGTPAVTAELTVRLKKPVPVGEPIVFEGKIEREEARVLYGRAVAMDTHGEVLAVARATCVKIKTSPEKLADAAQSE